MTNNPQNIILNQEQIQQKIRRIAFQIYEDNYQEQDIVFAGIKGSGYLLAQILQQEFYAQTRLRTKLIQVSLDKMQPVQSDVLLNVDIQEIANKTIIVVDDVLNTGRTLLYSLKPFLDVRVRKLRTVVLVDRKHKNFPISADYVGYSLSTTIHEHIDVFLEEENFGVFLS
ncbi:MAG: phosphoribosyltransferase family protein [Microscillaceae bacterium]|nr:phosphoribosyltransferase family protein [Microscillaceae bacterium]